MSVPLSVLLPLPLTGMGVSYTCGAIAEGIANDDVAVTITTPRAVRRPAPPVNVVEVLPNWTRRVPFRLLRPWAARNIDRLFVMNMLGPRSRNAAAYIWPGAATQTVLELKRAGITVFREMINCHTATAKIILDQAYGRLGINPRHGITTRTVDAEQEQLEAVDYILCPNSLVRASLLENGVPAGKLLDASYGWDPARLSGPSTLLPPGDGITAVFVGDMIVRKGVHLLLDYWARSGVKGRLVFAGGMEPAIKETCAGLLARNDVLVLGIVRDVGALYRSADVFVLPTLEEGGPMVTYESCGCGLPAITTPMGAGRIVRDQLEGFVIDPYDRDRWVTAFRTLAENTELRHQMGRAAAARAQSFTWRAVAAQRRSQMAASLADQS